MEINFPITISIQNKENVEHFFFLEIIFKIQIFENNFRLSAYQFRYKANVPTNF